MPTTPGPHEAHADWMDRCVPQMLDDGTADESDQAVAICLNIWENKPKKAAPATVRRAYGIMEVKSIDEDRRIIDGVATTPNPDRMGDVVEPMGARYKLPIPLLYQHSAALPVGEVFAATPTKDGIRVQARVFKASESKTLKDRLDEAWESVKIGLLKGFSIGFAPLDPPTQIKDTYSYRYGTWEWLELSLVTIPANAEATIQTVKSIDTELRAASGRHSRVVRLDTHTIRRVRREMKPGVAYLD